MQVKYLVVGAGVSGLAFTNFLNSKDYLIIEKENEVGGFCRTIYQDGYTWDYAGHFFHFKNKKIKDYFLNNINEDEIIYSTKCTKVYHNNRMIDYPFQKNIHQLEKTEFIDCLYDLFNKVEKEKYISFKDMLYSKFGKSISEKFLIPYNEKLYACNLEQLDSDAMGRFFPYANINEIINNMKTSKDDSYNNKFLYPKNGAITFINVLMSKIDSKKLLLNTKIENIDYESKKVKTNNGDVIEYEYLINTSPFNKFIELCDRTKYEEVKEKFSYNKVLVFNLGFDKKSRYLKEHWVYIADKNINFYRMGFYDNILDGDKLSMYIEIGYSESQNIDIEEELRLTLENLKKIGVIDDHKLQSFSTILMSPAYVHVNKGSQEIINEYNAMLQKKDIYSIGRYGLWKYCSIEDCIIDAINLAEKL